MEGFKYPLSFFLKIANECDLKFRDLETIKNTFVHIIAGQYHSRIEYPKIPGELKK